MEATIKRAETTKRIYYQFPNSNVKMFCVFIDEDANGVPYKLIKWSVNTGGDIDDYYMIDSLNPLRVLGGIAPVSEHFYYYLWETEEEILEFVNSLTLEKLTNLMSQSIFISYRDKLQMSVPPTEEIKLYEPTEEDIQERNKLLSVFNKINL